MPSSFLGLHIAASGMAAYSAYLNVAAHNVSNAKTPGYSRQYATQTARVPISLRSSYGMLGAGTQITSIRSARDEYYDFKYRKSTSRLGYFDMATYYMKGIEDYFYSNDSSAAGMSNSLNRLFESLKTLTESPADTTMRTEAAGHADTFAQFVNEMARNLQDMQNEVNEEISSTIDQINAYAEQIASLNKQINTLEIYGEAANDLRDQRALLVDELSLLADIDVVEKEPADGNGIKQFIINLAGGVLVDTYDFNKLIVTPSETKVNQGDVDGLYDIKWSTGQDFATRSPKIGGQLQALLDVRDGNNGENFRADFKGGQPGWNSTPPTFTMTVDSSNTETGSSLARLNIPGSKGVIKIANYEFEYSSFEVSVDKNGNYTYTFTLSQDLSDADKANLARITAGGKTIKATIGDAVEYRGIPYYMAQLNELVRTFSATFNQQQNRGYDLYGNKGVDIFKAKDATSGEQLNMAEFLKNTKDGYYYLNGEKVIVDDWKEYLTSAYGEPAGKYELGENSPETKTVNDVDYDYYTVVDKETGEVVESVYVPKNGNTIFKFSSLVSANDPEVSYYNMNAWNFSANEDVVKDGKLLAAASRDPFKSSGVEEGGNLALLAGLIEDETMFKQGNPVSFLQVMTATVGVDTEKLVSSYENAYALTEAADSRRLSNAGVDEDEEGQMLIEARNLLNVQYRVVSVMNEVLNKLINEMGI